MALGTSPWIVAPAHAHFGLPDPDVTPSIVEITMPQEGAELTTDAIEVLLVQARDPPPEASVVAEVWHVVDGTGDPVIDSEPP